MPELEDRLSRLARSTPPSLGAAPRPAQLLRRAAKRRHAKVGALMLIAAVGLAASVLPFTTVGRRAPSRLATKPATEARLGGPTTSTSEAQSTTTFATPGSPSGSAVTTTSQGGRTPPTSTASRPKAVDVASTTTAPEPDRYGVKPDAMLPGPGAIDPCLGRTAVPIAVAGNRSPDGRAWAVLQHGSVGTTDDVAETWSWHCKVLTVDSELIRPRGIVSWAHNDALVWGVTAKDEPVSLLTNDGGATWSANTSSKVLGATSADTNEVLAWTATGTHLLRMSTDSGAWASVAATGLPGTPTEVALVDRHNGWAFGRAAGDAGQTWLASTADGGGSWRPMSSPTDAIEGIGPSTDRAGCVLFANSFGCTSELGSTWNTYRVDVRVDHIVGLPPAAADASEWYRWTAVAAGDGGGVRFYSGTAALGGTTIDYTSGNPIRFLASAWGRYVTTNSWDGCIQLMDRSNYKNHAYALGPPAPDDADNNPC